MQTVVSRKMPKAAESYDADYVEVFAQCLKDPFRSTVIDYVRESVEEACSSGARHYEAACATLAVWMISSVSLTVDGRYLYDEVQKRLDGIVSLDDFDGPSIERAMRSSLGEFYDLVALIEEGLRCAVPASSGAVLPCYRGELLQLRELEEWESSVGHAVWFRGFRHFGFDIGRALAEGCAMERAGGRLAVLFVLEAVDRPARTGRAPFAGDLGAVILPPFCPVRVVSARRSTRYGATSIVVLREFGAGWDGVAQLAAVTRAPPLPAVGACAAEAAPLDENAMRATIAELARMRRERDAALDRVAVAESISARELGRSAQLAAQLEAAVSLRDAATRRTRELEAMVSTRAAVVSAVTAELAARRDGTRLRKAPRCASGVVRSPPGVAGPAGA